MRFLFLLAALVVCWLLIGASFSEASNREFFNEFAGWVFVATCAIKLALVVCPYSIIGLGRGRRR
jgi:hypothetical protein